MHAIPRLIHLTWPNKQVLSSEHAMIRLGPGRLQELNPGWTVQISDDQDVDDYLRRMLGDDDYQLIQQRHVVEKTDLWRLFKIYLEGGLYVDIDRFCDVDLDSVIPDHVKCVLPTCLDSDFSQDIMLSAPNNPIHYRAIMMVLNRRRAGETNIYYLGPQTYMHAVTESFLGQIINSNPPLEVFDHIRSVIDSTPGFMTYREYPPYNTFLYRLHQPQARDWVELKRDFYGQSQVRHWTNEW